MCFPIRRGAAAIAGVISVAAIACLPPRNATAGVVAPPNVEPAAAVVQPVLSETAPLPSPVVDGGDAQQFWYPGAKDGINTDAISLSSVPVQTSDANGTGTLAGAQQHPLIPLPGAAWTGMAGLLGLAAVKVGRNFRKLLA